MSQRQHYYDDSYPSQTDPYYADNGYNNADFHGSSYAPEGYDHQGAYHPMEYGQEYYDEGYDNGQVPYDARAFDMYSPSDDAYYRQENAYYDYPADAYATDVYGTFFYKIQK